MRLSLRAIVRGLELTWSKNRWSLSVVRWTYEEPTHNGQLSTTNQFTAHNTSFTTPSTASPAQRGFYCAAISADIPLLYQLNGASLQCKMNQFLRSTPRLGTTLFNNFQKIKLRETLRL